MMKVIMMVMMIKVMKKMEAAELTKQVALPAEEPQPPQLLL